jgi:hypothetical protein
MVALVMIAGGNWNGPAPDTVGGVAPYGDQTFSFQGCLYAATPVERPP